MSENMYASQTYFRRELKGIFRRNWVCAGFGHQVPSSGDVHPVSVGGMPLILVRGKDGEVRVFHNVCRHRGSKLVNEPCAGLRILRCPYHSWTFNLDGGLRRRPHFDGPDKHHNQGEGLWPVKSAMWLDLVFVDIDGHAGAFDDFVQPLNALAQAYGLDEAQYDETVDIEIEANWKLLVENFVDGYHISTVHPDLQRSVPTRTHRFRQEAHLMIGEAPRTTSDAGKNAGSYVAGLPEFSSVDSDVRGRLTYLTVFPNLCVNMTSDRFSVYLMQPLEPSKSLESIHNYYHRDAFTPDLDALRRSMTENQLSFNAEDIDALMRLQEGRSSDIYDDGQPSPYWDTNAEALLAMCRDAVRESGV